MTNSRPDPRIIACNRTLNLKSIKAVGYDMDYTLVHYHHEEWEREAYDHTRQRLLEAGWPVDKLEFDSNAVIRGLVVDTATGNIVKANRFGFVMRAVHGATPLSYSERKQVYAGVQVDLANPRWRFLNTLFSLSEGCIYRQLVDLLDAGDLPEVLGYVELYQRVRASVDEAHMEGLLKAAILNDPERYVVLDPETALTLVDQKYAGKKVLLVTNSDWSYARPLMEFAFDRFLPHGMKWRDLFDVTIVSARKPTFFQANSPLYEVVSDDGLLRPTHAFAPGKVYAGGSAGGLEDALGISGDEILYVGDHMFGDVHVTKSVMRWRTALILRELEEEIETMAEFADKERELVAKMHEKEAIESTICELKLQLQRRKRDYSTDGVGHVSSLEAELDERRQALTALDDTIVPLAKAASEMGRTDWGLLLRTGYDKSQLARQVERYADVYTSRVSNFAQVTPFAFLRGARGSLPHDAG